jgi:hypothetical protein
VTENVDGSDHFVLVVTNWKDINERQKTITVGLLANHIGVPNGAAVASGLGLTQISRTSASQTNPASCFKVAESFDYYRISITCALAPGMADARARQEALRSKTE